MNQPNRRNKSSAPYRASQGGPNEWVSPHVQQSAALANANGHAVSPLVRRKTIQNAQLGRPRNDYDRRQISNVGPNAGADLALQQSNLGPGTDSYTRSNVNARLYTGTPPSGHVATNAMTQLPVSPSSRQSRHTRNGSYTNHPFAAPVSINTNISSPPPSLRSPAAARGRTRRATTTTTTTTNAHSLLFSSNQPSSHPTSTMDNFFWPGSTANGHSVHEYDNITSVTSGPVPAPMSNQDSHGSRLYNYDGICPPAVAGSERMPRGLPADSRPGGKIAAASVVFLSPGSPSLPASNDNQRPVASLAEALHTNSGPASYHDTFPQLYNGPQTYSPPNPAAYYLHSVYDPMSTPMHIHPRSEHAHPQYLQSNYEGNPHFSPSYYSQAPPSPTSLRSPSQHHRASVGYAPYSLPTPNYMGAPGYHTNELVPTPDLNALIEVTRDQYISVPSSMTSGVMGSPLLHTSPSEPPSDLDRPHASPALKNASRFPGQRLDVDQQLLNASFYGTDEDSRNRRAILDEIQYQGWYLHHEQEPRIESLSDPAARGLGMVGRSIYTVFLAQDESGSHWRCLFGGHGARCDRSTKQFERVERAIEHVRRHLGHRPYACDDVCLKSQTSGAPCGQRFFASQYLQDHKRRPQKRKSTVQ